MQDSDRNITAISDYRKDALSSRHDQLKFSTKFRDQHPKKQRNRI